MKIKWGQIVLDFRFLLVIYVILVVFASSQSYFSGPQNFGGLPYTHYNNYVIFKQSFFHLIENKDLYNLYPNEHWDYYKYSPSFAFLFAPIAVLPDYVGLILWNLLNAIPLFLAILYFPIIGDKNKKYILWFMIIELMTSLQNEQSNGLIAGLIILAFVLFERKNYFIATLFIVLSVFIKLFGIVAFVMLLLYPRKAKSIAYSLFWTVVIAIIPLLVISFQQLKFLYSSWANLLSFDHSASFGLSVLGWLKTWFGLDVPKMLVLIIGVVLFCIPLLRVKLYKEFYYRLLLLSSVLLWIVIFNHKAESPTFIVAISGCVLWYFPRSRTPLNLALIIFAFIFTSLSPTDIFPKVIRDEFFGKYVLKAVPCIFIWMKVWYDMNFARFTMLKKQDSQNSTAIVR